MNSCLKIVILCCEVGSEGKHDNMHRLLLGTNIDWYFSEVALRTTEPHFGWSSKANSLCSGLCQQRGHRGEGKGSLHPVCRHWLGLQLSHLCSEISCGLIGHCLCDDHRGGKGMLCLRLLHESWSIENKAIKEKPSIRVYEYILRNQILSRPNSEH